MSLQSSTKNRGSIKPAFGLRGVAKCWRNPIFVVGKGGRMQPAGPESERSETGGLAHRAQQDSGSDHVGEDTNLMAWQSVTSCCFWLRILWVTL